ncbi:MAG: class I SAM-dependent methyltransferase [Caldilineaceae bacterium]
MARSSSTTSTANSTGDPLTLDSVDFLFSAPAKKALTKLQGENVAPAYTLQILTELRKEFTSTEAAALLRLAQLRIKAADKFPHASEMFFVGEALEQATAWQVALQRAQTIHRSAPPGPILDLGCGIGGDTLALAQFRQVIAYERDPVRIGFAAANAQVYQVADKIEFRCADWQAVMERQELPHSAAVFVDPARRADGKRIFSLYEIEPPLPTLLALQQQIPLLAAKVMPGVQDEELPDQSAVQFVSHEGVCKEAVLWLGHWRAPDNTSKTLPSRWATVYDQDRWWSITSSNRAAPVGNLHSGQFLYEPDPAVIRSGALFELCEQLNAHLFDSQIAYLVSDHAAESTNPFYTYFEIEEIHPFSLKLLNQRLRALGVGQVELKKRGFPEEPERLRPRLTLTPGGRRAVLFFTRRGDERLMLIGTRCR